MIKINIISNGMYQYHVPPYIKYQERHKITSVVFLPKTYEQIPDMEVYSIKYWATILQTFQYHKNKRKRTVLD